LVVSFLNPQKDKTAPLDWGSADIRPTPVVYFNNVKVDSVSAVWKWINGKEGILIYKLPGVVASATRIVVDLNGVPYLGKPIWQRNRKKEFVLP
jgi:hypothetical protein